MTFVADLSGDCPLPEGVLSKEYEFRGWGEVKPKRKLAKPESEDSGLDLNGNTFGMLPPSLLGSFSPDMMSEGSVGNDSDQLLQVKMSPSLVSHLKAVLGTSAEPGLLETLDSCLLSPPPPPVAATANGTTPLGET